LIIKIPTRPKTDVYITPVEGGNDSIYFVCALSDTMTGAHRRFGLFKWNEQDKRADSIGDMLGIWNNPKLVNINYACMDTKHTIWLAFTRGWTSLRYYACLMEYPKL